MVILKVPQERGVVIMARTHNAFRNRLDIALNERNMKPSDLAKASGISEATISQYRSGYSKPKYDRLVSIAEVLNVDPVWLIGMDVPMEPTIEAKVGMIVSALDNNKEMAELFELLRKIDANGQNLILTMARELAKKNEGR